MLTDSELFEAEANGSLLEADFSAKVKAQGIYNFIRREDALALSLEGKGDRIAGSICRAATRCKCLIRLDWKGRSTSAGHFIDTANLI